MMPEKQWIQRSKPSPQAVEHLAKAININSILATLLVSRNIDTYEVSKQFFRAGIESLHDPFLMADMHKAVNRIVEQTKQQKPILIYGDYDVDGTTAVALMALFFNKFYPHYEVYIPNRYDEGYGLSKKGIDYAEETQCSLVIALDCGIRDHEAIAYAKSKQIDVIVCDHHSLASTMPDAVAVLNPKRPDCTYPYDELSGCGIGFKLTQALTQELALSDTLWRDALDLVAVSTAADMVPLTGENRILVKAGIEKLSRNPQMGLASLMSISGLGESVALSVNDIVFRLAPRINAAGRMAHGLRAVELMKAQNPETAKAIADELHLLNQQRQDIEKDMIEDIIAFIESKEEYSHRKSLVAYMDDKPQGILGIVASKLAEKYHKPTIVLTNKDDSLAVGSARSVEAFDLYSAIEDCCRHLEKFGGHRFAAGVTLKISEIEAFETCFEEAVKNKITPLQEIPKITYDAELSFSQITPKFINILNQFCPFGPENRHPVFMTTNLTLANGSRMVGKHQNVMRLLLEDEHHIRFTAVGFGLQELEESTFNASAVDICYVIEENTFRGTTSLQLRLKDIRPAKNAN